MTTTSIYSTIRPCTQNFCQIFIPNLKCFWIKITVSSLKTNSTQYSLHKNLHFALYSAPSTHLQKALKVNLRQIEKNLKLFTSSTASFGSFPQPIGRFHLSHKTITIIWRRRRTAWWSNKLCTHFGPLASSPETWNAHLCATTWPASLCRGRTKINYGNKGRGAGM